MTSKVWTTALLVRQAVATGKTAVWLCATEAQAESLRTQFPDIASHIKTTESVPSGVKATALVYDEAHKIGDTP